MLLDAINQVPFHVGLEESDLHSQLIGKLRHFPIHIVQGHSAVDTNVPAA